MARTTAHSGGNKAHNFDMLPSAGVTRSAFNRSSNYKTTFDSGKLIPFFVDEILPGDTMSLSANIFARLSTPLTVLMDNIWLDFFFFFVPNRLVWDKWQYFMGEEESPGDAELPPKYSVPQVYSSPTTGWPVGSTADYLGIPTGINLLPTSALPFRAINLIYSEWFRDENIQDRPVLRRNGGVIDVNGTVTVVDVSTDFPIFSRGKRKDYFTSALPWPQKGPAVLLPLGDSAPVTITGSTTVAPSWRSTYGSTNDFTFNLRDGAAANGAVTTGTRTSGASIPSVGDNAIWANPALNGVADLGSASATTINELRQAFQIQRLLERDARGGTRYTELIKSHFQVSSPDARLQRPEYLGGGTVPVSINPVAQTTPGQENDGPLATLSAFGTAAGNGGGFSQSFTEHGHVIGFVVARADLNYQDGLNRFWSRKTRFDYYWPALQAIGEQPILQKEIYAQGDLVNAGADDQKVFGYIPRWDEYRYRPNLITGQFRSSFAQSLDIWHLAQEFTEPPTLSPEFIIDNPPIERIVAVPSEPEFLLDAYFRIKHVRPMPVFSVPGLIDHF